MPRRHRWALAGGALVAAAVGAVVAHQSGEPHVEVRAVSVTVQPALGHCPAAEYTYTATVTTNGAKGTVALRWVHPDGRVLPVTRIPARAGQRQLRTELRVSLTGRKSLGGRAVARLPGSGLADVAGPAVRYTC